MSRIFLPVLFFLITFNGFTQTPPKPTSSAIFHQIQKLNFLGKVLYVAAHPDDENTRLITYFSKEKKANTAYISLTRGDGGQNLIGPEIQEKLGLIRSQELLAARRIDGGKQFFSRAIDFGYSKNPTEAFSVWNKNEVMADLVWAIRKFQPDIIINRFDHRTPGSTHGHHTASAILSVEAFDLAADETKFPEQLNYVDVWQPKSLYFNDSWFFYGSKDEFKNANHDDFLKVDIGNFYPLFGQSNNEIAALSRSEHKSQGFGSMGSRGEEIEYLELIKGKKPDENELFSVTNTTWSRVKKGKKIGKILSELEAEFDFEQPWLSIPKLLQAYQKIEELDQHQWKTEKLAEIKSIILACSGLFLEATSKKSYANPGDEIDVNLEIINRSPVEIKLKSIQIPFQKNNITPDLSLAKNQKNLLSTELKLPEDLDYSTPFWLQKESSKGLYQIENQQQIHLAENESPFRFEFVLEIDGVNISFAKELVYKYSHPVDGEVYENFSVQPKISLSPQNEVLIFSENNPKKHRVTIKNFGEKVDGKLHFETTDGWKVEPKEFNISFDSKGEEKSIEVNVIPPEKASSSELKAVFSTATKSYSEEVVQIDYAHIPQQNMLQPASTKLVNLDVNISGKKVAYLTGAGDQTAQQIQNMGYQVDVLEISDLSAKRLISYDAVVVGIRAFNIYDELSHKNKILFDYAKAGGNLIIQYNTSRNFDHDRISPIPLRLSRNRVTDENSEVRFIDSSHSVLNYPNKITKKDFENWVQERGLYFPDEWDEAFQPVISMNDKNEEALESAILVADYGSGKITYTGLSFFRQLPAGVPGAFRLFANLLSQNSN
ncbi:MAG: PIG-L family deacetylase [Bacteroidota bacterium]